jgi:DNA polymerase III sliding clamp (beta) subunit (PCNA family)
MDRIGNIVIGKSVIMPFVDNIRGLYLKESHSEIYNGIYIKPMDGAILLKACNFNVNIEAVIKTDCSEGEPFLLQGKRVCEAIKAIPGDSLSIGAHPNNAGRAVLQSGKAKIDLIMRNPEGYPTFFSMADTTQKFKIVADDLRTMITLAKIGSTNDTNEPKYKSVGFVITDGRFDVVSTNGSRIVVATKEVDAKDGVNSKVFVDRSFLKHLEDVLKGVSDSVTIGWTDRFVIIEAEDIMMGCIAQSFVFPDYQKVLAKGEESATRSIKFDRSAVGDALRFVTLNAQLPTDTVVFSGAEDGPGVRILFTHPDFGDSEIVIDTDGEWPSDVIARFNHAWISEIAAAITNEQIGLRFHNAGTAWIFTDPTLNDGRGISFRYSMMSKRQLGI